MMPLTLAEAVDWLAASGVIEAAVGAGEMIPDFELKNTRDEAVSVQALLDRGPLAITFTLGIRSPCCRRALGRLQSVVAAVGAHGGAIVAITPDLPAISARLCDSAGLGFDLLHDNDGHLAALFGITYLPPVPVDAWSALLELDPSDPWPHAVVPLPAAYVVSSDGIARMAFLSADPLRRVGPQDLVDGLTGAKVKAQSASL
jgi:peroxiredoxin